MAGKKKLRSYDVSIQVTREYTVVVDEAESPEDAAEQVDSMSWHEIEKKGSLVDTCTGFAEAQ